MTTASTTAREQRRQAEPPLERVVQVGCSSATPAEESECPSCGAHMRRWAAFYRCGNCGYKESCCF